MNLPAPIFTTYRVAAIQYEPTLGEKERNVSALLRLVETAAQHDARLIVLPEIATTGYCWLSREEIAPYVEPIPGPTTDRFQRVAAQYGCYIAISLPEVDPTTNAYYNSMALLGPEGMIGTYRKIHSYISEPRWARDGDLGMPVWETPLGRLTGLICMDAEYFEAARIPALHGADVLLFPTNWNDEHCPSSWWMARAFENGVYLIAANRYGREREVQFSGGSCILNPDGSIQAFLDTGDGIVYGEVDLERARDKRWGPANAEPWGDRRADRQPAEYTSLVNNTYLWEPLRYHGLYEMGELPAGQLSCVGFVQMNLDEIASVSQPEPALALRTMISTFLRDNAPACPDVLVLPELALPGPLPASASNDPEELAEHFRRGAITLDGPETKALIDLANDFQLSLVLGVAEREPGPIPAYYNSVFLIDPEGVYGVYRKLHLTALDRLWASPGNKGLPTFDTPAGRVGLATGYDVLFPETLRVLAGKGADLVCAPALLAFPDPIGLGPTAITFDQPAAPDEYDPLHYLIWRVRAAEHNVYLALANWNGQAHTLCANGHSGIFSPTYSTYPWPEVLADEGEMLLTMMTIDTREQRTGRRSSQPLRYTPGSVAGSLTGELSYDIRDSIPGNVVRSKPLLRKRQPFWYLDLVKRAL
ncbi:MAG TPA: nitrilase-related carbon-nitrogen hydrolase [Ktedonobacteraceae bacterium]|nr:nitrilase-related carbon-nitrogen hydrolase [Ktedonobacteraceae bacterium]